VIVASLDETDFETISDLKEEKKDEEKETEKMQVTQAAEKQADEIENKPVTDSPEVAGSRADEDSTGKSDPALSSEEVNLLLRNGEKEKESKNQLNEGQYRNSTQTMESDEVLATNLTTLKSFFSFLSYLNV
jgi:hypothetical protein